MANLAAQDFIDAYARWIKENTRFSSVGGYTSITTPFLDRHNDCIEIYVKQKDDIITLSDDGHTLGDLAASGVLLNTEKRRSTLYSLTNGVGVNVVDGVLTINATSSTFAQKKHALVQAMLSVNDMFMLSQENVATLFLEDVAEFLDAIDVRYTPSIEISGKSGLAHRFDFVIPASKSMPERILRTINSPSKQGIESALFAWSDVRETRPKAANLFVFLNDSERKIRADMMNAFNAYDVLAIPWSKRHEARERLIA